MLALSVVASAQGPQVSWSAPAGCPNEAELVARLETTLQEPLVAFDGQSTFDARVTRSTQEYRLVLSSQRGEEHGVRVLTDRDCDALTSAAAVAIALALQTPGPEPRRPAPEPVESTPAPTSPAEPQRQGESMRPRPWFGALLVGRTDSGTLPPRTAGAEIGLAAGLAPLLTSLRVGVLGPGRHVEAGRGGIFRLETAAWDTCVEWFTARTASPALCALVEVGRLSGVGRGVDHPRSGAAPWVAPGARVMTTTRLGHSGWSVLTGVVGLRPLGRPRFVVNGDEQIHRSAGFVGRLEVGILAEVR